MRLFCCRLKRRKAKMFRFTPSPVSSAGIFWWTGLGGFSTRGCVLDPTVGSSKVTALIVDNEWADVSRSGQTLVRRPLSATFALSVGGCCIIFVSLSLVLTILSL
jgi:hypothetical protein